MSPGELFDYVVPHTGDVDRNAEDADAIDAQDVVPHTGDVDRNILAALIGSGVQRVVPHTGDVDRNSLVSS